MTAPAVTVNKPQRWDVPFGADMTDADVDALMANPAIAAIKADNFPAHAALRAILRNDGRIVGFEPGDIVVREGDYGNSAFLVLSGNLRVVMPPGLSRDLLGRQAPHKKGFLESFAQLWRNRRVPEVRDAARYRDISANARRSKTDVNTHVFIQDIPRVLGESRTAILEAGDIFGELAALGRVPRSATIFAETDAKLFEIRWQGLRELRRYDPGWKRRIDDNYRRNALKSHLEAHPLFKSLETSVLEAVMGRVRFKTFGSFDWHVTYKQMREAGGASEDAPEEPIIAAEGTIPDGVYLVRAGFARVSMQLGNGQRTVTYLGAGDHFGLTETYTTWKSGQPVRLLHTLTALGYVDVLRVPASVLAKHVFPNLAESQVPSDVHIDRSIKDDAFVEWMVDERLINGTQAMLIDLERCVRCDDCVKACGSTHGGNPRFIRHGFVFDGWMVANACMHCRDPVCMIGCPTGAIHRHETAGVVVINDDTCIGCGTCARSCPYDNIRLVEVASPSGDPMVDEQNRPIAKATKCDLCVDQPGGPACVRACPHDALRRVDASTLLAHDIVTTA